jgi:serine/threonine-protein phosphatase 5
VTDLYPNDADAKKRLAACEKAIREEAFLKAIETDNATVTELPKPEDFAVESDYQGPRLPDDGVVTEDFVLRLMEDFKLEKPLHRRYVAQLLVAARKLFLSLPSLVEIPLPSSGSDADARPAPRQVVSGAQYLTDSRPHVTVCGDTHGQFYDLCNIFNIGGLPSSTNPYLFNGDFVDRGSFSFEVVMVLLAWKLANPSCIHLTRGNHESSIMNKMYGFEGEVKHKMKDDRIMNLFKSVFNSIPLAAVVGGKVFVVHGGLSTQRGVTLADIRALNRDREPPSTGLMADLLWSGRRPVVSLRINSLVYIIFACMYINRSPSSAGCPPE